MGQGSRADGGAGPGMSRPLVDVRLEGLATGRGSPPLAGISLHVRYGEFFTLLGPPHSGKSAVLRAVAGFLPLDEGRVLIDGQDVGAVPPGRRGMGYVVHEGALWPHLGVGDHVAFGLVQQGMAPRDVAERVAVVIGRLGLGGLETVRPPALTLDQRRRLALARALAVEPRVLLLDEPLAHLDPIHRKTLRLELARLHRDLAVTTICATRDAADALALSDRLAVLGDGRVLQVGDAEQLYQHPITRRVAEALGPANFLPVTVVEVRDLGVVVETEHGDRVPVAGIGAFREGDRGLLVLRPETLAITEAAEARGPGIPARIALRVFEGARYLYEVDIGVSAPVRVEVPSAGESRMFRLGERVRLGVSSETVVLVPVEGESGPTRAASPPS
jgi:ABC-type Fe3+/spermidine/putrescine transport system ATPase subunit